MVKMLEEAKVEMKKGERSEQRRLQIDDDDTGKQIGVEGGGLQAAERLLDLLGRRPAVARSVSFDEHLFPNEKHGEEKRAHGQDAEREEEQNAGEFADEVFVARNGLGQDGVNGAVLEIAREELSRRHDREKRA